MPVHLFLNAFYLLFNFFFNFFFFIAPFSSSGILEHCVCPVTRGNKEMTNVSVLIYSSDVKFLSRENAFSWYNEVFLKNQMSPGIYCYSKYIDNVMVKRYC